MMYLTFGLDPLMLIDHGRHDTTFNSYWLTYTHNVDGVDHFTYERFNFAGDFDNRMKELNNND